MKLSIVALVIINSLSGNVAPTETVQVDRSMDVGSHGGTQVTGSSDRIQVLKETTIVVTVKHQKVWKCSGWLESNWGGQVKVCGWQ